MGADPAKASFSHCLPQLAQGIRPFPWASVSLNLKHGQGKLEKAEWPNWLVMTRNQGAEMCLSVPLLTLEKASCGEELQK